MQLIHYLVSFNRSLNHNLYHLLGGFDSKITLCIRNMCSEQAVLEFFFEFGSHLFVGMLMFCERKHTIHSFYYSLAKRKTSSNAIFPMKMIFNTAQFS